MLRCRFLLAKGLKKRADHDRLMGFYNGEEFVFTESKWALVTMLRLLWRYRLGCVYIFFRVNSMLSSFSRYVERARGSFVWEVSS